MTKKLLDEAKFLSADCIVLACPLCATNLEFPVEKLRFVAGERVLHQR